MKSTAIDLGTGSAVPKEPGSRLNLWNDLIFSIPPFPQRSEG